MELYNLAIIGGGPGGIGSAVEATILGVDKILMIEKGDNHSQTIRKYYKDAKRVDKDWKGQKVDLIGNVEFKDGTKESTLDYFDSLLDNEKITTAFKTEVEKVEKEGDIFKISTSNGVYFSKYVIVAIGRMGKPNKPSYKIPPSLKKVVNFNLDHCRANEKILVVGGGDTASEYACELSNLNTVTLNYRKPTFTRLNPTNLEMLTRFDQEERLRIRAGIDILGLENEKGKVKVNYNNGYSTIYDRVIYAIGGTTPVDFLKKCSITLTKDNEPIFDDNLETEVKGLYIAGDIVFNSGGSIAMAINHGHTIVKHIKSKDKDV